MNFKQNNLPTEHQTNTGRFAAAAGGSNQNSQTRKSQRSKVACKRLQLQQAPAVDPIDDPLRTPLKQLNQLEIRPKTGKQSRLLSSKSLSQLVSRSLFFKKRNSSNETNSKQAKLDTCKSFPTGQHRLHYANPNCGSDSPGSIEQHQLTVEHLAGNRVQSDSMIVMAGYSDSPVGSISMESPSVSKKNSLISGDTLVEPSLSPIVGQSSNAHYVRIGPHGLPPADETIGLSSTARYIPRPAKRASKNGKQLQSDDSNSELPTSDPRMLSSAGPSGRRPTSQKQSNNQYKPFKNTALALRDIKNSISLVSSEDTEPPS